MKYSDAIITIKKLLKEGKVDDALNLALAVRKSVPNDETVHKLIKKCTLALHTQDMGNRGDFLKNSLKIIKTLKKEKKYAEAARASKELLEEVPESVAAQKLYKKTSVLLIEQKLHDPLKKQLEAAGEFEKLYQFYQKLAQVFPEYTKLKKLIKKTEKKLIEIDRERKKEFSAASLEKIKLLFSEGKYEQVINGAKELQAITHQGSKEAQTLLQKATRANEREIEKEALAFMKTQQPLLQAAYESGEAMIKI